MKSKEVLVISDIENYKYWSSMKDTLLKKIRRIQIILNKDFSLHKFDESFGTIIMDISDIDDLHHLIPKIHDEMPMSQIIILSSTPTWKQTREVISLGATNLIRKRSNLNDIFNEVDLLENCAIQ